MDKLCFWQLLNDKDRIEIPLIQRDYVQGRQNNRTRDIAMRFVAALGNAIKKRCQDKNSDPLVLDFIFGSYDNEIFVPFDGQQRLTTLWLLHLYAAVLAGQLSEEILSNLARFQYAVREDTTLFCRKLLNFMANLSTNSNFPAGEHKLSGLKARIQEQSWFLPQWKLDPTIDGMLNMLEYLDSHFHELPETWELLRDLEDPPIQFYFQDIAGLKIAGDDLFIKMNARGKQLTEYEIFKARFLEWLELNANDKKIIFTKYLNRDWQNLFWSVFGRSVSGQDPARYTDECFCRFLRWFAIMTLHYGGKSTTELKEGDLYRLCSEAFKLDAPSPLPGGNLDFLEKALNTLLRLENIGEGIEGFFANIFCQADESTMPNAGHISWFKNNHLNMFKEICAGNPTQSDSQMLFAILIVLAERGELTKRDKLNLRILRNLLTNSTSEIYEAKFQAQLPALAELVLHGKIVLECGYNGFQLKEEEVKLKFRENASESLRDKIDWLEDHPLLRGCLAIFSTITSSRSQPAFDAQTLIAGQKFFYTALGSTPLPWDTVLQGFLASGKFGLQDSPYMNKYIYLGAEKEWDYLKKIKIFTTANDSSFPGIRESVQNLAQVVDSAPSSMTTTEEIEHQVSNWLQNESKLDWRWYFAKYSSMRPDSGGTYGRYDWVYSPRSFEQRELKSKTLHGEHWNPFLKAVYIEAGLEDTKNFKNRIEWVRGEDSEDVSQIVFHISGSSLALWPFEFFWWINTPSGRALGSKQAQYLATLQKKLACENIIISEDGTCVIPGVDSAPIDYNNFDWDTIHGIYRMYDTQDRIQIGVKIAHLLANMQVG